MTDELDLNRLRGGSGLVLEEHSHCEVPAGCGGAILRWVRADTPCSVDAHASGDAMVAIDGVRLQTVRVELAPGAHVLTIETHTSRPLLATLTLRTRPAAPGVLVTRGDGTWRYTNAAPPPSWTTLEHDASEWPALEEVPMPVPSERLEVWRLELFTKRGAVALGAKGHGRIWVRRVFVLDAEGLR